MGAMHNIWVKRIQYRHPVTVLEPEPNAFMPAIRFNTYYRCPDLTRLLRAIAPARR
jgi:hypothetical protein